MTGKNKLILYGAIAFVILLIAGVVIWFVSNGSEETKLTPEEIEEQRLLEELNKKIRDNPPGSVPPGTIAPPPLTNGNFVPLPPPPKLPGSKYALPKETMLKYIEEGSGK